MDLIDPLELAGQPEGEQRQVMEEWFRAKFEDPAQRTPSDGGEYVWIWGGPHDAEEELKSRFEGLVPDKVIEELAHDLSLESSEWAPTESSDDYDHTLLAAVEANDDAFKTLEESLRISSDLVQLPTANADQKNSLNRMIFASIISALEAFLSDVFIKQVLKDKTVLRKFFETCRDYQKRTVSHSETLA